MKRRVFPVLFFLWAILAAAPGSADDLRPGIIGKDDRITVGNGGWPWDAIGQVNIGGYRNSGKCTGTLVAPDLVLTAAHCVMDRLRQAPFPLHTIHYLAGARLAENKGHSTAKCLHFLNGYDFVAPGRTGSARSTMQAPLGALLKDAALIVLNDRLAVTPATLGDDAAVPEEASLVHAAYPADRRFVLSAHANCRLLRSPKGAPLWFTDCDTHPASSGGPIFLRVDGTLKLVAIMVATAEHQANIALPISEWAELLRTKGCP
jgi:protease YdgD